MTIEKATIADIKGTQQVIYKTWLATYPNEELGITVLDIEERFKHMLSDFVIKKRTDDLLNLTEQQLFLVAKDQDTVIGFCKVEKTEAHNELKAIYVLPEYQRQGVGTKFWLRAMEFFDKGKNIIVQVATYNEKAIRFYKKLGFVDTGKRFTQENLKMPVSGVYIPEMELIIKVSHN